MLSPKIDVKGSCLFLLLFIVFFFLGCIILVPFGNQHDITPLFTQKKIKKENND
jgi:hypothetical protein